MFNSFSLKLKYKKQKKGRERVFRLSEIIQKRSSSEFCKQLKMESIIEALTTNYYNVLLPSPWVAVLTPCNQ